MNLVKISLCLVTILAVKIKRSTAGSCYAKIEDDGKCFALVANDVSEEECCSALGIGFNEEISDELIFMLAAGIRKESCKPCRETCDKANCGIGKRCVMKKGFPKCVCAPNCKANKYQNTKSVNNEIALIRKSETRNLKRNEKRLTPIEMQNDEPTIIVANFDRLQSNKKTIQQLDDKKSSDNQTVNATRQNFIPDRRTLQLINGSDDINSVGMKIRSGAFNEHTASGFTYVDGFHVGSLPKFSHYNPICGSDRKTYKNECQLRKRACRQEDKKLEVAYRGHCQSSCEFIKCSHGKTCVEDQNGAPQCLSCPRCSGSSKRNLTSQVVTKMVCGADGVTYRSICELRQKSCKLRKSIPLLHRGPCTEALSCNPCSKTQKCLPDLMTHQPKCVACHYKCPRKRRTATGRKGDQVCGKNNVTYHSWCHLMKDSCNTGYFIDMKHEGPCLESS